MRRRRLSILLAVALACAPEGAQAQGSERVPPNEAEAIEAIRTRAMSELKGRYPESQQTLVRRDAHAKAHGCVKATFEVDPTLPQDLRVGTFSQLGQRFKALLRFSNGAFEPGPDTGSDGRGMAVKIIGADPNEKSAVRQRPPHDILMINYPVFFSSDVADYRAFAEAGALTGDTLGIIWHFAKLRFYEAYVAYLIASQKITSPLAAQYHSMAPFQFGEGRAVKYSARQCAGYAPVKSAPQGPDFLKEALWSHLSSAPACFELLVQERKGKMDVENTLEEWSESASPFRRVGKIDIASGQSNTPERDKACESLTFNPWHGPAEQRPLGGINRLRKVVYEAISGYRNRRNNVTPVDAAVLWDGF